MSGGAESRGTNASAASSPRIGGWPVFALLAMAVSQQASVQADWPFIRGPHFDGQSDEVELADTWPEEGPPVLWTLPLGQGYSSFIAWDDFVATQFQTLAGQFVICLNAETGAEIWRHRYDLPYDPIGVYPGPRATPTYADGKLYFTSPAAQVGCLSAKTGRLLWSVDLAERFGPRGTDFGYSCSPTIVEGLVILPVGGPGASMVALDAASGNTVWQAGDDPASYTPAYPISFQGRKLVLGYLQNALVCHELTSGQLAWRHELSVGYDEHSAWPLYSEPDLWISGPFQGGSKLLRFTGDPAKPVVTVRISPIMSNDIFSSVLVDGAVYGFDLREAQAKTHRPSRGQFRCIDFATGEVHWSTGAATLRRTSKSQAADEGRRIGHATVIVADGKLILLNDTGELILARASTRGYQELARTSVLGGEICWTQPALSRGRLLVRNHNHAACVYLGDPQQLSGTIRDQAVTVADIPQTVYVDWAARILQVEPKYAFDIPSTRWLCDWYLVSLLGIMGGSLVLAQLASGSLCLVNQNLVRAKLRRRLSWLLIFVLGALGTTVISARVDDFVFTWPVSLFIAFHATVWEADGRHIRRSAWQWWRGLIVLSGFLVICLAYFLLCRRLSLVFEWVFLCGFMGALPLTAAARFWFADRYWSWLWEIAATAAAFTAFFWCGASILWLRS